MSDSGEGLPAQPNRREHKSRNECDPPPRLSCLWVSPSHTTAAVLEEAVRRGANARKRRSSRDQTNFRPALFWRTRE